MVCPDDISQQKNMGKIPPVNLNQTHRLGWVFQRLKLTTAAPNEAKELQALAPSIVQLVEAFQLDLQTAAGF